MAVAAWPNEPLKELKSTVPRFAFLVSLFFRLNVFHIMKSKKLQSKVLTLNIFLAILPLLLNTL